MFCFYKPVSKLLLNRAGSAAAAVRRETKLDKFGSGFKSGHGFSVLFHCVKQNVQLVGFIH